MVRVFRAAWFELDGALGSLAGLSCTLEAVLVQHLEAAFGEWTPSVTPVDGLLDGAGRPQVAQSTQTPPPSSSQFFTQMLLVVNLDKVGWVVQLFDLNLISSGWIFYFGWSDGCMRRCSVYHSVAVAYDQLRLVSAKQKDVVPGKHSSHGS